MKTEGVTVTFTPDAIDQLAYFAFEQNKKVQNIGARRLHTIMEALLDDLSFRASELPAGPERDVIIDATKVRATLGPIMASEDLARYIL